jgi:D-serine dehydratase
VLKHAETLAYEHGLIEGGENYQIFADEPFKNLFGEHSVAVGSTGNLGLSIGVISAKLGFNVTVHMSADAKQWKKDLLRGKGAKVVEYDKDFSVAIDKGRELSQQDPKSYFVDDESSQDLFLGYSVAALRLKEQLKNKNIAVDKDHPLFVYLPCGVGGSPGGISFGLKHFFGDDVHCFFVEPTHSPSVLLGLMTGKHSEMKVQDFDIDNKTEADGLAVGTPSKFATKMVEHLVSGDYTIRDDELFKLLALLIDSENTAVEPSSAASLFGPIELARHYEYIEKHELTKAMSNATHIAWMTGGAFVPKEDMEAFYEEGKALLK